MKKTIVALMALAGLAAAAELSPVWSSGSLTLGGSGEDAIKNKNIAITLSDGTYITSNNDYGYTAVVTLTWTKVANAPMFWLGTDDGSAYGNSTATFGFDKNRNHAGLFSTGGSNGGGTDDADGIISTLQDNLTGVSDAGVTTTGTSLEGKSLTFFITSKAGTSTLYSLTDKNEVVKSFTRGGMATGNVTGLHVGHWRTEDTHYSGTLSIDIYKGVMETSAMQGIAGAVVPEPTTATLSLLALAGLAARRRRK